MSEVNAGLFRGNPIVDFYMFTEDLSFAPLRDGARILDVGCGDALFSRKLLTSCRDCSLVGVDIDAQAIGQARRNCSQLRAVFFAEDCESWICQTESSSFDYVHARLAVHHFRDPVQFLHEAVRVIKPGGAFLCIDIDRESACWDLNGFPVSVFLTYLSVLSSAGIRVGMRAIKGIGYGSQSWKDHRARDIVHRQAIGWYRYADIREKVLQAFPDSEIGRVGSLFGYGGVHFVRGGKNPVPCAFRRSGQS